MLPPLGPLVELIFNTYPFGTRMSDNIKASLDYTGNLLNDGWSVPIFPERRMNRHGLELQPLRGGAGILAVEMRVPVVPMSIIGSEQSLPPEHLLPRRHGPVHVRFGAPLHFAPPCTYDMATRLIAHALSAFIAP